MSNTIKHISDAAEAVDFNPSGTNFPTRTTNVQSALASLGSWCLSDVGMTSATTSRLGVVQLATLQELITGTDVNKVPSAQVVNQFVKKPEATESTYGTVEYATTVEAMTAVDNRAISPKGLSHVFANKKATEGAFGTMRLATTQQARDSSDDTVVMTPLKTLACINAHLKVVATATERNSGIVQLANSQQIADGTIKEGFAISPHGFANARGTSSAYGTFKAASGQDVKTGTSVDKAVTPKSLFDAKGSISQYGIVSLTTEISTTKPNHALASNAKVLPTTGGIMTGDVNFNTTSKGVRWDMQSDFASIKFHCTSDSGPATRLEFEIGDNNTEYFSWTAKTSGGSRQIMKLRTDNDSLEVKGAIYENGNRVYSPVNKPVPSTIGAMADAWGATQWTGYINQFDCDVDWECPWHHVMVGVYSCHDNRYEDRRFRYKYKRIG